LAREPLPPREGVPYKTSIAFSMKEDSGALFKALACFALRDINLTKVGLSLPGVSDWLHGPLVVINWCF
jgi:prephenate dehydratase